MSAAETLFERARTRGVLITTAESCTGGMIAGEITSVAGSSEVFDRGYITYSNAAKTEVLGVKASTLRQSGAVSEEVAAEMAVGALQGSNAGIAVSVTGVAGPGGSGHKPEGRVCFGLAQSGRATVAETMEFGALGRAQVRHAAAAYALDLLIRALS